MPSPKCAVLACLLLSTLATRAQAQDADPLQDAPGAALQTIAPPQKVSAEFANDGRVDMGQGWTGAMLNEAQRLEQQNVAIQGAAPTRTLHKGDTGDDVQWLIQALIARGYLMPDQNPLHQAGPVLAQGAPSQWGQPAYMPVAEPISEYTDTVEMAVRALQADNGLKGDGIAGNEVYRVLTVDDKRLASALASWANNVQYWSMQARQAGYDRLIVVNVPSFTLHAIDLSDEREALQSRVIVGKPQTPTPLMLTHVVNLKANPDWSPPPSIRGARYQRPGPKNALGLMRFSTDNNMNIYLHDTNSRGLFENDTRALSHGCVRVKEWHALAAWAARQDETWVDEVALAGGKTRFLKIDAIPVVITYSVVDMVDGKARQFEDIYGRGEQAIGWSALRDQGEFMEMDWTQAR